MREPKVGDEVWWKDGVYYRVEAVNDTGFTSSWHYPPGSKQQRGRTYHLNNTFCCLSESMKYSKELLIKRYVKNM